MKLDQGTLRRRTQVQLERRHQSLLEPVFDYTAPRSFYIKVSLSDRYLHASDMRAKLGIWDKKWMCNLCQITVLLVLSKHLELHLFNIFFTLVNADFQCEFNGSIFIQKE